MKHSLAINMAIYLVFTWPNLVRYYLESRLDYLLSRKDPTTYTYISNIFLQYFVHGSVIIFVLICCSRQWDWMSSKKCPQKSAKYSLPSQINLGGRHHCKKQKWFMLLWIYKDICCCFAYHTWTWGRHRALNPQKRSILGSSRL